MVYTLRILSLYTVQVSDPPEGQGGLPRTAEVCVPALGGKLPPVLHGPHSP